MDIDFYCADVLRNTQVGMNCFSTDLRGPEF